MRAAAAAPTDAPAAADAGSMRLKLARQCSVERCLLSRHQRDEDVMRRLRGRRIA